MGSFWKYDPHQAQDASPEPGNDEDEGDAGASFERLLHAWHPSTTRQVGSRPPVTGFRFSNSPGKTVLLCLPAGRELLAEHLDLAWPAASRQSFRLASATLRQPQELDHLLSEHRPHLLLIDADLCAELGAAGIRRLRRAFPGVDWIVGWQGPVQRHVDVLIHSHARGCVAWDTSPPELARALQTVLVGELWFPRSVMQTIYLSLLTDLRAGAEGDRETGPRDRPREGPAASGLTAREAEVLALTRQGLTNKQIAARLDISVNTVKKHLASAFEKRGLRSRRQVLA